MTATISEKSHSDQEIPSTQKSAPLTHRGSTRSSDGQSSEHGPKRTVKNNLADIPDVPELPTKKPTKNSGGVNVMSPIPPPKTKRTEVLEPLQPTIPLTVQSVSPRTVVRNKTDT
eukprot:gene12814-3749_t